MTANDIVAQATSIDAGAPARADQMWLQTDWSHISAQVRRLQVRIAKATLVARCHSVVLKNGLSRMRGDSHVRFLGGRGAAMSHAYLTRSMGSTVRRIRCGGGD